MEPQAGALALELERVERSFATGLGLRRKRVLAGVDLALERGRTLGLFGPNGSGKSTLLRLAAGVDRPSAGSVRVLGHPARSRAARARVGWLPEDSPFPGELSPRATLDLLGALAGLARRDVRTRGERLLVLVGLAAEARTPLRRFSRGMLRRFGLAQAFLAEPELVLLDEPTAGLDAPGFGVLERLLAEARARGAAVVLASHLPADLVRHADRLALLVEGRLAGQGTPDALLGAEGRVRVELADLDEAALGALRTWVEAHGGRWLGAGPARRGLVELYREHAGG